MTDALVLKELSGLLQQGKSKEGLAICEYEISENSKNVTLLSYAGIFSTMLKKIDRAQAYFESVISILPDDYSAHKNLANLHRLNKDYIKAKSYYEKIIKLYPKSSEAFYMLGRFYGEYDDLDNARSAYEVSVSLNPKDDKAYYSLALLERKFNLLAEAIKNYKKTLKINPEHIEAHNNLGILYQQQEKYIAAQECFEKALKIDSFNSKLYCNLGKLFRLKKDFLKSQEYFEKALTINPEDVEAYNNLGKLYLANEELVKAKDYFEKCISHKCVDAEVCYNLGVINVLMEELSDARLYYKKALAINPNYTEALWNYSMLLLRLGDFLAGWKLYEARCNSDYKNGLMKPPKISAPQYQGESLSGKTILVCKEQGFGDEIQFIRYLPLLKSERNVSKIILLCKPQLKKFFSSMECIDLIVDDDEFTHSNIEEVDCWLYIMSLPLYFETTIKTIPNNVPYLSSPKKDQNRLKKLMPASGYKVGICWKGNPNFINDSDRSLSSLTQLKPLWNIKNVTFISLQKGVGEDEAKSPPKDQPLVHLGNDIDDFSDTAAIVSQLDLVICTDTAIAHVAGSLGVKTFVLLAYSPDWRWFPKSDKSPWYPQTKLFRQEVKGDWGSVIDDVAKNLQINVNKKLSKVGVALKVLPGLAKQGKGKEGLVICKNQLLEDGANVELLSYAGIFSTILNDVDGAQLYFEKIIEIIPTDYSANKNLGLLFEQNKNYIQSVKYFEKAFRINPDSIDACTNLARTYKAIGELKKAKMYYEFALEINPNHINSLITLGVIHAKRKQYSIAKQYYEKALEISPDNVKLYVNIGVILQHQKKFYQAIEMYKKALEIDPSYAYGLWNRALLLLKMGEFCAGWKSYESRYHPNFKDSNTTPPRISVPQYKGGSLVGKTLLVYKEQGFGDEIQFVRYLPLLKQEKNVSKIILVCKPELKKFFVSMKCIDLIIDDTELNHSNIGEIDYWVYIMSLPLYFETTIKTIPNNVPYLSSPKKDQNRMKKLLPDAGFKVGICWKGNPKFINDSDRSLSALTQLKPLWNIKDAAFISLQKGVGEDEAKSPPKDQPLVHLGNEITNFSDTAAIVSQLDLVICTDTAIAHVAGSLGIKTFVMLSYSPDWRWFPETDGSPWYPQTKLFRQEALDGWESVIDSVAKNLQIEVDAKSSIH